VVERKVWEREGVFGFGNLDRMSLGRSRKCARMVRKKKIAEKRKEKDGVDCGE
jgi:hypothetical protein